ARSRQRRRRARRRHGGPTPRPRGDGTGRAWRVVSGVPADLPPSKDAATTGGLVRSSALVGIGTGLSRVTGLFRTVALTYAIGTTLVAEGYNLANTTPNIVYDLILGGILSATLVPLFVDRFEHDDEDGVSAVVTVTVAVLVAVT